MYNPHCSDEELGREFIKYLPICKAMATSMLRRGRNYERAYDAAVHGLEAAASRWNPNQASCPYKCQLGAAEHTCSHGGVRITLGAYARKFIHGEVIVALRQDSRDAHMRENTPTHMESDTDELLQDGSSSDGTDEIGRWSALDREKLALLIDRAIVSKRIAVSGMTRPQLRSAVKALSSGHSLAETATLCKCSDKAVARLVLSLRSLLAGTPYDETSKPREMSLGQIVVAICDTFYPEAGTRTRQTIAKRIGKWAANGRVPATRGSDRRWIFSSVGLARSLELWHDIAADEPSGRR